MSLRLIRTILQSRYFFCLYFPHNKKHFFIIHVEVNVSSNLIFQVRITASWALANICDSFRQRIAVLSLEGFTGGF